MPVGDQRAGESNSTSHVQAPLKEIVSKDAKHDFENATTLAMSSRLLVSITTRLLSLAGSRQLRTGLQ